MRGPGLTRSVEAVVSPDHPRKGRLVGNKDFERERREFIDASSKTYYPYSWELDGHPAMRRPSLRRLRHPWKQTRSDWIKSVVFLLSALGTLFVILWVAWMAQAG
jgi:hypothetical protein